MDKKKEKVAFNGRTEQLMKENLIVIKYMELEYIYLMIKENILENGKIIKWMVMVNSSGQMEGYI
jgi:hypothetical protein